MFSNKKAIGNSYCFSSRLTVKKISSNSWSAFQTETFSVFLLRVDPNLIALDIFNKRCSVYMRRKRGVKKLWKPHLVSIYYSVSFSIFFRLVTLMFVMYPWLLDWSIIIVWGSLITLINDCHTFFGLS